jgi:hypothetical protein
MSFVTFFTRFMLIVAAFLLWVSHTQFVEWDQGGSLLNALIAGVMFALGVFLAYIAGQISVDSLDFDDGGVAEFNGLEPAEESFTGATTLVRHAVERHPYPVIDESSFVTSTGKELHSNP